MIALFLCLMRDRSGATVIEYGLIALLISTAIIGGFSAMSSGVETFFGDVSDSFQEVK